MSGLRFLHTRSWVIFRRSALIAVIILLGLRTYGDGLFSWLRGTGRDTEVVVTKAEFHPDLQGAKPAWVIGLRNLSRNQTFESIELQATYFNAAGKEIQQDKLVVKQKLVPGDEQLIGAIDVKSRPGATAGSLKVLGAASVTP